MLEADYGKACVGRMVPISARMNGAYLAICFCNKGIGHVYAIADLNEVEWAGKGSLGGGQLFAVQNSGDRAVAVVAIGEDSLKLRVGDLVLALNQSAIVLVAS